MKKWLDILKKVLVWFLVIVAAVMMIFTLISVNTFDKNDRTLFGYRAYIVRSDSMSKTDFKAGDLVLTKEVDAKTLKAGDIISFISVDQESYGETVTHKIRKVTKNDKGELAFVTYGTTTDADDKTLVTYDFVLGKYKFHIPKIGAFFNFIKTVPGYLLCIFLPFFLLTVYQSVKSFMLFKKYKEEQMKEIENKLEAERLKIKQEQDRLEEERKQTLAMIEELKQMKNEELAKRETKESNKTATTKKKTSTVADIDEEVNKVTPKQKNSTNKKVEKTTKK